MTTIKVLIILSKDNDDNNSDNDNWNNSNDVDNKNNDNNGYNSHDNMKKVGITITIISIMKRVIVMVIYKINILSKKITKLTYERIHNKKDT